MRKEKLIPKLRFPEFKSEGEWKIKLLGKIASITTGSSNREDSNLDGKYTFFDRSQDIRNSNRYLFDKEAIIVPGEGQEFIPKYFEGKFDLHQRTYAIFDFINTDGKYLFYFISQNDKYLLSQAVGSTVKSLRLPMFEAMPIGVPKLNEQQKIASCLSSLDEVILAHSQKLELLKDHKKGLMQNLFPAEGKKVPKYRFKEFEKDGEWVEKKLGELFEIGNGRDYKHLEKGEVPVYGSGGFMLSVDDFLYEGESACIGRKGTIDKPMFLTGKFWTVDTLFYTHSFKDCLPKYIFYVFENINWRNHNEAGGVPSLSKSNIYKIEILIPKIKEQQKIASCLSALDELITAQAEKIEELKEHKKGLMQGLFPKMIEHR